MSSITVASALSSVCCSRITSAVTTESPASIIVANWREKTCSDFGLTPFVERALALRGRCLQLLDPLGEKPVAAQELARGGEVGRLDLAGELGALGVDRAVRELRHLVSLIGVASRVRAGLVVSGRAS